MFFTPLKKSNKLLTCAHTWLAVIISNLPCIFLIKWLFFKVKKINTINSEDSNGIKFSYKSNNEITVLYEKKKHKIDEIIDKIKNAGMEIYDISTDEGNLEDVFIDLTKS